MADVVARVSSMTDIMPMKPDYAKDAAQTRSITGLFIRERLFKCFCPPVASPRANEAPRPDHENPVVEASLHDDPSPGDDRSFEAEAASGGASALWVCKPSVGTWYTKPIRLHSVEPLVSSCVAPAVEDAQQKPAADAPADKVSLSKPAGRWATELSHKIGSSLGIFKDTAMMLDTDTYKSVSHAVSELDAGRILCESGICIVYSVSKESYFLLFRSDAEQAAYERYGLKASEGLAAAIVESAATADAPDEASGEKAVSAPLMRQEVSSDASAHWARQPSVGTWLALAPGAMQ